MKNKKKYLMDGVNSQIAEMKKNIKESGKELEILNAKLKIENKLFRMEDVEKDLKEDIKYSVMTLEGILMEEENKNAELQKELKILQYRKQVINKFEEKEL